MPAYNFQKRFASLVESGKKRQTIREFRKRGNPKPGDTLYLYTGQRTTGCRKIGEHKCLSVEPISIDRHFILVNGKPLPNPEHSISALVEADGFESISEFMEFFEYQYDFPFDGVLIKW